MSTSLAQPKTTTSAQTTDKRIVAGDNAMIAQDGSSIHIESLDAGLAEEGLRLMKGLAENSNDGAYSLSKYAMDIGENITNKVINSSQSTTDKVLDALTAKDEKMGALVDKVSSNTSTTMRDLFATLFQDGKYLGGSADQSGGVFGWISRNPVIAAALTATAAFFGYALLNRKK